MRDGYFRGFPLDHLIAFGFDRQGRVEDHHMPQHQGVKKATQRRQVQLLGGNGARQLVEVAADLPRRQAGQLMPAGFGPGEEAADGMAVGPPCVQVADAGGEEFIPDERCRRASRLDECR